MALVTLTTDFGTSDPFVGIMKGVIASRAPDARVIDLTHGIPPQDVRAGALVLRHAVPYFPSGTIHVAVVDPGVGGARRPLCVETATAILVGPDNGLLALAALASGVRRIVHLTESRFFLPTPSATFHGRDVFAPVAAALATGTALAALGGEVPSMEQLDLPEAVRDGTRLRGEVIYVDHFGNLVTNVSLAALAGFPRGDLSITIAGRRLRGVAESYSMARRGDPVAVLNSWGLLEVAVRDGSAQASLGAGVGTALEIDDA